MRKINEIRNKQSCLNRANPHEMLFVLMGRDAAAPATIRFWAAERLRLGKNRCDDAQIREALQAAAEMEENGKATDSRGL